MGSNLAWMLPAFGALAGLLIGSFLNVCIYRIVRDQSVVTPRSYCPACGESIAWFDNIPVVSYVLLGAKCRHCRETISLRYPLVELLTAAAFFVVAWHYGWQLKTLKWCVFEAILITLFFTDLEERLLPDELTMGGTVVGLVFAALTPVSGLFSELLAPRARPMVQSFVEVILAMALLTLPLWGLATFWGRLRGRTMLGLGDVKLLLLIGAFLALENGIYALLIGSVSGVLIGGGYILLTHKKAGSYELPLGTFFCLGAGLLPLIHTI